MQDERVRLFGARLRRKIWGARTRLGLLPRGNAAYNRELWDLYARSWEDADFVRDQVDPRSPPSADLSTLSVLGEEWADSSDLEGVISEFVEPYVSDQTAAAEIGVGGGRIAARVAPLVRTLLCFDISEQMLRRARTALAESGNVQFFRLEESRLPADLNESLDFVYAFDVFMHLDLHTMWRYVQSMTSALRPGGRALLHAPSLAAPAGWKMFAEQDAYSVEDGWFITPDVMRILATRAGLRPLKESVPDDSNLYLNRDYLLVAEKPHAPNERSLRPS